MRFVGAGDAIPYGALAKWVQIKQGAKWVQIGTALPENVRGYLSKHRHAGFGYDRVEPDVVRLGRERGDYLKAIAKSDF